MENLRIVGPNCPTNRLVPCPRSQQRRTKLIGNLSQWGSRAHYFTIPVDTPCSLPWTTRPHMDKQLTDV